ncbi:hypothetical protein MHU86_5405 [Fragilaria crotonensis]|nr:hypothetical protein MHU86_5405 [Fragilaria crotonensis]
MTFFNCLRNRKQLQGPTSRCSNMDHDDKRNAVNPDDDVSMTYEYRRDRKKGVAEQMKGLTLSESVDGVGEHLKPKLKSPKEAKGQKEDYAQGVDGAGKL